MAVKTSKLAELKKKIPFKWKVQTINDKFALCVAYIDARDVFNVLDEVVGPENWTSEFTEINNQMFCKLGIKVEDPNDPTKSEWIYKMDTGTEAHTEAEKSKVSDAIKRAAVQFGIGRFLYEIEIQKVNVTNYSGKYYPCDDSGKILWTGNELTDYINNRLKRQNQSKLGDSYAKPDKQPTYSIKRT